VKNGLRRAAGHVGGGERGHDGRCTSRASCQERRERSCGLARPSGCPGQIATCPWTPGGPQCNEARRRRRDAPRADCETMRETCCARNCRPARLRCPSAVSRAATARRDNRDARSSRARAIVACSRLSTTSLGTAPGGPLIGVEHP
jgi:hypothetical protein